SPPCARAEARPPNAVPRSTTVTRWPAAASRQPAASPARPAPTTATRRPGSAAIAAPQPFLEPLDDVAQRRERPEGDRARRQLCRERVLGEDEVGRLRATQIGDTPVPDVHHRHSGVPAAEGIDASALAGAGAARTAGVGMTGGDAPGAVVVAQLVC